MAESTAPSADDSHSMEELAKQITASYLEDNRIQHLDAFVLPNQQKTIKALDVLRRLIFPGFFEEHKLATETISPYVGDLLTCIQLLLFEQINAALRYEQSRSHISDRTENNDDCQRRARQITQAFLKTIPTLRRLLATDVQAAFDGDPAAVNTDETVSCYPGLYAIFTHRISHELYLLKVPLLPRIMSEHAHNETGIDIHPGAQIGESFFIDHGTGVVIGETTEIGNCVQIYQGVTLGAMAPKNGNVWRGRKRHPTIEDDVVIYANATILGGDTVIGKGCVISGSVVQLHSVPPGHTVKINYPPPELRARQSKFKKGDQVSEDFQI